LIPREDLDADNKKNDKKSMRSETGMQTGTPYVMKRDYLFEIVDNNNWFVQTTPPWGTLNAIDLSTGKDKWQVPVGFMMDTTKYPDAKKWGSLNLGGSIVTAGNLVFVAATRDGYFRAFHAETGEGHSHDVCCERQAIHSNCRRRTWKIFNEDGRLYCCLCVRQINAIASMQLRPEQAVY
jgi:glucose dehydrogenase